MSAFFKKRLFDAFAGSLFISNSFTVPGQTPDEIVEVADRRKTKLLIWRM